jgi:hypothetical protein
MIPMPVDRAPNLEFTLEAIQYVKDDIENMGPNTRVKIDTAYETYDTFERTIHYLRGDGDRTFGTIAEESQDELMIAIGSKKKPRVLLGNQDFVENIFTNWLKAVHIEMFLDKSKFTNKVRVIDRAIRTIRDIVGENQDLLYDPKNMTKVVAVYNTRPHAAFDYRFTPKQAQLNPDIEEFYIRENMKRCEEVTQLQREAGLFEYKPGNILLIHLDKAKTSDMFNKKRRAFNELAMFVGYQNGNVVCRLLKRGMQGRVVGLTNKEAQIMLPIYYTKYVAPSLSELPKKFLSLIF